MCVCSRLPASRNCHETCLPFAVKHRNGGDDVRHERERRRLQVVQVAAGGMHSVALTPEGEVWTTGVNDEGALGRETGEHEHLYLYLAFRPFAAALWDLTASDRSIAMLACMHGQVSQGWKLERCIIHGTLVTLSLMPMLRLELYCKLPMPVPRLNAKP